MIYRSNKLSSTNYNFAIQKKNKKNKLCPAFNIVIIGRMVIRESWDMKTQTKMVKLVQQVIKKKKKRRKKRKKKVAHGSENHALRVCDEGVVRRTFAKYCMRICMHGLHARSPSCLLVFPFYIKVVFLLLLFFYTYERWHVLSGY